MTPEGKVKALVKKFILAYKNIWHFMPPASAYGRAGIPDFILCVPVVITQDMVGQTIGRFVTIETKAEGNLKGVTGLQSYEMHCIREAGGLAYVVDGEYLIDDIRDDLKL